MISLMRKLLAKHDDRLFFAGIIVIAANSGGAWSPIGDVTTTMLWIGGQITTLAIIRRCSCPPWSAAGAAGHHGLRPCAAAGRGPRIEWTTAWHHRVRAQPDVLHGLGILVAVPAFKTSHPPAALPGHPVRPRHPVAGRRPGAPQQGRRSPSSTLTLAHALSRIDMSSLVFFIGILLAVATLEHTHILTSLAQWLDKTIGHLDVIVMLIGMASAIVDNVPLVAASMGMYRPGEYPTDHFLWEFLAYCAGTGGSILIIGSAAGVAAMGLWRRFTSSGT
jgi:Na+/H+ antiporter NhaD/arsenite permease-like protein